MTSNELINTLLQFIGFWFIVHHATLKVLEFLGKYGVYKEYRYELHIPVSGHDEGIRSEGVYSVLNRDEAMKWCEHLIDEMRKIERPEGMVTAVDIMKPYEVVTTDEAFKFEQNGFTFLICHRKRKRV